MAKARDEGSWFRASMLMVPLYNQFRDPEVTLKPYTVKTFYPWPNQLPEIEGDRVKPSEVFFS